MLFGLVVVGMVVVVTKLTLIFCFAINVAVIY